MTWLLPTPLLAIVALVAFLLAVPRAKASTSSGRLFAEAFGLTILSAGVVWLVWVAFWWINRQW